MKIGDFTNLANDYAKYRPSYNKDVVKLIVKSLKQNVNLIKAADIGAGTGIFTKCLIDAGINDVTAVEPNESMRTASSKFLPDHVKILAGSAEHAGSSDSSFDLVTMASSFHWPETSAAIKEFDRILAPNGVFAAVWNPRLTDRSDSERKIQELLSTKYNIGPRVSSGLSGITSKLRKILESSGIFRSVVYIDAVDIVQRTHEEYLGAWRSVSDIQVQLGKSNFSEFLKDVEKVVSDNPLIEVHYLTRAWIAMK